MHAAQGDSGVSPALCRRLLFAAAQLTEAGRYRLHCRAADATLLEETPGGVLGALAVNQPLLVLTEFALVVLAEGGLHVAAVLRLEGTRKHHAHHTLFKVYVKKTAGLPALKKMDGTPFCQRVRISDWRCVPMLLPSLEPNTFLLHV